MPSRLDRRDRHGQAPQCHRGRLHLRHRRHGALDRADRRRNGRARGRRCSPRRSRNARERSAPAAPRGRSRTGSPGRDRCRAGRRKRPCPGRASRRVDGSRRRTRHRAISPQPDRSVEPRSQPAGRVGGHRAPLQRTAQHHDGPAHGARRHAVRPLPPPRARPVPRDRQIDLAHHGRRGHRGRQDRGRAPGRSAGASRPQRRRSRARNARAACGCRQVRDRPGSSLGPPGRWRGRHLHQRRRPRHRQEPRTREGGEPGADPAGRADERARDPAAHLPAGLLDGCADHQPLRPWRRHGRGEAHGRGPARVDRHQDQHRPRLGHLAAHPADARHHRWPARPRRQWPLRDPAVGRGGVSRAVGRGGHALARAELPVGPRCAGAFPAPARSLRHRHRARSLPEGRRRLDRV